MTLSRVISKAKHANLIKLLLHTLRRLIFEEILLALDLITKICVGSYHRHQSIYQIHFLASKALGNQYKNSLIRQLQEIAHLQLLGASNSMNALNCTGGRRNLPPLHRKTLKPSLTCGINPHCSLPDGEAKDGRASRNRKAKNYEYDPFNYDRTAMARDLLRGFIFNRKASLTTNEREYLEDLAVDGEENDLNNAMMVLSDEDLFFHPCRGHADKSVSSATADSSGFHNSQVSGELSSLNYSNDPDFVENTRMCGRANVDESQSYSVDDLVTVENRNPLNSDNKEEKEFLEDNVEIIESVNGAVILQDLKLQTNPLGENINFALRYPSPKDSSIDMEFVTPPESKQRSRSVPYTMPAKLGTSYRLRRVAERKESSVHSNMWKAHKQGLSLTLNASSQSIMDKSRNSSRIKQRLFNGKINRSLSPFIGERRNSINRGGENRSISRGNTSRGSAFSKQQDDSKSFLTNSLLSDTSSIGGMGEFRSGAISNNSFKMNTLGSSYAAETNDFTSLGAVKEGLSRNSSTSTLNSTRDHQMNSNLDDDPSALGIVSRPRRLSRDFLNYSQTSISALDLAINDQAPISIIMPETMPFGSRQDMSSKELPAMRLSESQRGDSMASFPSLNHGMPMGDSMISLSSLPPPRPSRQASEESFPSLQPSRNLFRDSSIVSTDSSVTLNSLSQSYILRQQKSNQVNFLKDPETTPRPGKKEIINWQNPEESETSPRHKAPMRPSRNPSPLVRPKIVQRAKSDSVLPPKHHRLNSVPAKAPIPPAHKAWTKMHVKKRSIDGKFSFPDFDILFQGALY